MLWQSPGDCLTWSRSWLPVQCSSRPSCSTHPFAPPAMHRPVLHRWQQLIHWKTSTRKHSDSFSHHCTCMLSIFLCTSECWAITKVDAYRIDGFHQWCLRTLLGIKWHQFVRNQGVRKITKQPNLTAIIQSWHLSILGHIGRMDDDADAKMILMAPLQRTGRDHQGVPVSRGWTPSNEIWKVTTSHWMKQSTLLRTALCGGWRICTALRSLLVVHARKEEVR